MMIGGRDGRIGRAARAAVALAALLGTGTGCGRFSLTGPPPEGPAPIRPNPAPPTGPDRSLGEDFRGAFEDE